VGYDLDPEYVDLARTRVEAVTVSPRPTDGGKAAAALAAELIEAVGFTITHRNRKLRGTGLTVPYIATDSGGRPWYFDVSGAFTTSRDGMLRTDTVWKALGRAHVLANNNPENIPLVFLTSDLPRPGSEGDVALRAVGPSAFFDAIALRDADGIDRLRTYAEAGPSSGPATGFWTGPELDRRT
jgi:hypothetical protein